MFIPAHLMASPSHPAHSLQDGFESLFITFVAAQTQLQSSRNVMYMDARACERVSLWKTITWQLCKLFEPATCLHLSPHTQTEYFTYTNRCDTDVILYVFKGSCESLNWAYLNTYSFVYFKHFQRKSFIMQHVSTKCFAALLALFM